MLFYSSISHCSFGFISATVLLIYPINLTFFAFDSLLKQMHLFCYFDSSVFMFYVDFVFIQKKKVERETEREDERRREERD